MRWQIRIPAGDTASRLGRQAAGPAVQHRSSDVRGIEPEGANWFGLHNGWAELQTECQTAESSLFAGNSGESEAGEANPSGVMRKVCLRMRRGLLRFLAGWALVSIESRPFVETFEELNDTLR